MYPIIYVEGRVADAIGGIHLQEIADHATKQAKEPVAVMTWGPSELHDDKRVIGAVEASS